jgi:VanZ family protein
MNNARFSELRSRFWALGSIGSLCAVILAGFWPFQIPENQVAWLSEGNGLRFGGRGIALSEQPIRLPSLAGDVTIEIKVWAKDISGSGTILAFDDVPNPSYVFAVRQFGESVVVQRPALTAQGKLIRYWWSTNNVFTQSGPTVLTIASSKAKATLYVNGIEVSSSWDHGHLADAISGTMILGNSAVREGWQGDIAGLAIYNSALSSSDIEQHAKRWLLVQNPIEAHEAEPAVLYLFDERAGRTVHDAISNSGDGLIIPARYRLAHREFLTPVWVPLRDGWDSWRNWNYWSDLIVNVTGFVPFGFFFTGWLSQSRRIARPLLITVLLGICMTLSIECIQYYLPTRDSSMTDLLTNSLGTWCGVVLYQLFFMRTRSRAQTAAARPLSVPGHV